MRDSALPLRPLNMHPTSDRSDVLDSSAPTSEVGYAPQEPDREENENEKAPKIPMEVFYENKMLKQQSDQIEKLVQALKQPSASTDARRTSFPQVNPDKGDVEAKAWCDTAALCMEETPLTVT